MTRDELAALMAGASAVDPYFPAADQNVLDAWHLIVADVPYEVGLAAFRAHYRTTKETITPADIAWVWREKRRHLKLTEIDPEQLGPNPRQSDEQIHAGVDRVIAALAERKAIGRGEDREMAVAIAEGDTAARREYLSRPCPFCKAVAGARCTNGRGEPLKKSPAHDARLQAAQVEARGPKPVSFRTG